MRSMHWHACASVNKSDSLLIAYSAWTDCQSFLPDDDLIGIGDRGYDGFNFFTLCVDAQKTLRGTDGQGVRAF